jgi:hypothetical protein
VPKTNLGVSLSNSGLTGNISYNGVTNLYASECYLLSVTSETYNTLIVNINYSLANIIAPKAKVINANLCALTDKSIGDILYAAYADNRLAINFNFSEGTNALQGAVNTYLQATYGVTYATVYALLVTTNLGTILIDTV